MANSTKISEYSTTAANNTSIDSIDIDENCAASGINNAIRSVLKHQADAFTQGTPIALDQTNNRLGVGTVSPSSTLNVSSGAANTNTTFESSDATVLNRYKDSGGSAQISSTSGDLKIATGGDTSFSGLANNLVVTSGGDTGIGTASPNAKLDVEDTAGSLGSSNEDTAEFFRNDGTYGPRLQIRHSTTGTDLHHTYSTTASNLTFSIANTERARIDSSGNVGIGTTTINDQLVVNSSSAEEGITVRGGGYDALKIGLVNPGTSNDGVIGMKISNALRFITNDTERMRIDNSGRLLQGVTTASGFMIDVGTNGGSGIFVQSVGSGLSAHLTRPSANHSYNAMRFDNSSASIVGTISVGTSSTSFNTSSDHRLKENVADMTGAIDRVKALAPKRFNFIADADTTVDGFLAHEAQAVVPEAVTGTHNEVDDDGNAVMQGIDQSKLVPLLTGALQEAITKIETLETEMTALKARVTALEA